MNHYSLTESQFKTFRADTRNAAREETRAMAEQIKKEVHDRVIEEARVMAAQVIRKDFGNAHNLANSALIEASKLAEQMRTAQQNIMYLSAANAALTERIDKLGVSVGGKVPGVRADVVAGSAVERPKDGDRMDSFGETFFWWWGQWRRPSELEGFASWMARQLYKK